ncbi:metallophosphoesterase [Halorussus ruber]|uniref:metallophosphoesterase n=1 Tax=Halorussus ruber TaxID=1126238 RepID=UPI001FEB0DA2|nr:metallophosphoesterase [Halorussus ruber]
MAVESPKSPEIPESPETPEPPGTSEFPEVRVPDGETPPRCPYCARPFRTERLRALHLGDVHAEESTDDQRVAYDEAREAEREDLFLFHLKVVAALVAIYALLLLAYMAASAMQTPG